MVAAAAQTDQHDIRQTLILFEDFVGDAHQGATHPGCVENLGFCVHERFLTSRDELKVAIPARS
jgi:hypothetical protein